MQILENYDLTNLNTFHIKAKAGFFVEIKNERDLIELFNSKEFIDNEKLFLGGGSNVLFTKNFDGIVVLNRLKGIEIIKEDTENVFVKSMGGEWWNDLVNFSVERDYWGIENLSLIPGTVGATPVQNIGAYGVELKDVLESVEAFDVETGQKKIFSNKECEFGYRDSAFKNKIKGKYFISAVILKLNKKEKKNLRYKALQDYLDKNKIEVKSVKDISDAVAEIRRSKLPDPKILGNAGSFFKNVYVNDEELKNLLEKYPEIPYFKEEEVIKIPTGWLIEQSGPRHGVASWKGYREGNVGVYDKQALVLVNHGGAIGEEIKNLAFQIIDSVYKKFGLKLTPEVNLI
ncbi:MAG: UDP-N-acetylmuramate dehydrogenase [bacterium]